MMLYVLAYFGGLITILSPCILPVLPFVFTRADQPFRKNGLPLLIGMALTFTFFSTLAVIGGAWVTTANVWGRDLALGLLLFFGISLIFPQMLEVFLSPLKRWGEKLTSQPGQEKTVGKSMVLGIATGLLWAPCAGPILGLILTGSAVAGGDHGGTLKSVTLLFAYALGAGTSLALALVAGGKFFSSLKKYLRAEKSVRVILGVLVILGVAAIGFRWDQTILTRISRLQTESLESHLLQAFHFQTPEQSSAAHSTGLLDDEGTLPSLDGAVAWLNSPPLSPKSLQGKVVLIDFWTYSCINCLRTLPYVKAWAEKYKDQGLVVVGVHTPEFAFEKDIGNVKKALSELGITYPVAIDNNNAIWNAFHNSYWPAHYFIDRKGHIRHHHFGEGNYDESEKVIQALLAENGGEMAKGFVDVSGQGALAGADLNDVLSPETYIGDSRAENRVENIKAGQKLLQNQWGLLGAWKVDDEKATLIRAHGKILYRFHARDLHLVLGASGDKRNIRFKVTLDGKVPSEDHGADVDAQGNGVVKEHRLYQLIRQKNKKIEDHLFEIEFLDPGVQAFAFTFG
jgi:cytochrome c biogenesis protein CcdA/thiol-disulfide isomerase/thioredoxin